VGINVEPSMRPTRYVGPNPDGWWCVPGACNGVSDGTVFVDAEMALVHQLGVQTLRVEFPWALMEPTSQGLYDWRRSDYIVNAADRAGVTLQPVIVFSPLWEAGGLSAAPRGADFASFLGALVGRYKSSIHYWEMWNEPDLATYFSGSQAQYVSQVLVPGFQAIHAADHGATVILGGPSGPKQDWLEAIYTLGGGQSFDIMAFHDYSGGGQINSDAQAVEGVLQRHDQAAKPLWLGEYGIQEASVQDAGQQDLMTSVLTGTNPLAMAQWYNLRDDFSMLCCPPKVYKAANWGLVMHDDTTLKQGFGTLAGLARSA
jgi:hypothetical protein